LHLRNRLSLKIKKVKSILKINYQEAPQKNPFYAMESSKHYRYFILCKKVSLPEGDAATGSDRYPN
jgi:hypothetical protein